MMPKNFFTKEPAPHSLAKHEILREYLNAWLPILGHGSRGHGELWYVDGFAGPGSHEQDGTPGSPLLALKVAREHHNPGSLPLNFLFINVEEEPYLTLEAAVEKVRPRMPGSRIELRHGPCAEVLGEWLQQFDPLRRPFGPALVFLDQFGYSKVPMTLVNQVLSHPRCEVLTFLEHNKLNAYLGRQNLTQTLTSVFGDERWQDAIPQEGHRRQAAIKNAYESALREFGGARYVWPFAMYGRARSRVLYWLFFCTNHLRGLEVMKQAMYKVDPKGTYSFSDREDPNQLALLDCFDDHWLRRHLLETLVGQQMTVRALQEYILQRTPCATFAQVCRALLREGRIEPTDGGRKSIQFAVNGRDGDRSLRIVSTPATGTQPELPW